MPKEMTRVRALRPTRYNSILMFPGSEFDIETRYLFALSTLGKVQPVEAPAQPEARPKPKRKGAYKRRDMRAE